MATLTGTGPRTATVPGFLTKAGDFYEVRTIDISHAPDVRDFYMHGLSDESRWERFLAPTPRISNSAVRSLSDRDGYLKVALAAVDRDSDRIVGIAEYAWNPAEPDEAPEVAYAVADAYQGEGIGGVLLQMLAALSIAGGHNVWRATVLPTNKASLALLNKVGNVTRIGIEAGLEELEVELDAPA